eukprot:SM000012S25443  [mRNA]  locus=s12:1087565:1095716:- [translate_table: standard]
MYIAYGWPKILRAIERDSGDGELLAHVSVGGGLLVIVSSSTIQVWTAGQHRVKLGELVRSEKSISDDGGSCQAFWNHGLETLAVVTAGDVLHFYDINRIDQRASLPHLAGHDGTGVKLVRIKFRSATTFPISGGEISITSVAADDDNILLGQSNGHLQIVSWRGQLRGSANLWREHSRDVIGPMYVLEANGIPCTPMSPFSPHVLPTSNGRLFESHMGIAQLEYSEPLRLLVAVLMDGRAVLCSVGDKGLRPVEDIVPEKWVGLMDAVCTQVAAKQQVLAVGSRRGTVELFNLAENAAHLRTISLHDWGYGVEDTGAVSCICWSPDNAVFAVGWRQRGLAVWSVSGCRLMCTIRQGSLSNVVPNSPPRNVVLGGPGGARKSTEPMVQGVAQLAWGEYAYQLIAGEQETASRLVQFPFARGCMDRAVAGSAHVWQLMQAEDRVLLIQSDEEDDLKLQHLVIPQTYMRSNWPVRHVAANDDGSYLAIAGQRGLILYNLRHKRWRVFGDVSQERALKCMGLLWLGRIIVICNHREATNTYELSLYPRYHLDESSLLYRQPLPHEPIAMDSYQDFILIATPPFEIRVFHVHIDGELSPLKTPPVQLTTVRELSIMSAKKPLVAMQFVPNSGASKSDGFTPTEEAVQRQPTRCMLLRMDGELSLLDLERGSERPLVLGIEHFWLTQGRPEEEAALIEEVPWWAYGHRGMQVWYPSSDADTSAHSASLQQLDPELDFDREVYPVGVSPAAGVIVGISQRLSLSACADMPCFEPIPKAQPILPCLLRHLLQRNKIDEAVELAQLSADRPHFSHSLEWLLFTVFDAEMTNPVLRKRRKEKRGPTMLDRACELIRHFPEYLDVVVSVARKTDGRHWQELFASAGKSTDLFEECFAKRQYRTATCYILVIEKLEGPTIGQQNALRLLQATLSVGMYELAGELVRFLLRSGREYSSTAKEADGGSDHLLKSFFSFGFTTTAPQLRADVLHATVKNILGDHALLLLRQKDLHELVAFARGTQFELDEFLRTEKGRSARLEDFPTALRLVYSKLRTNSPRARLDAEFVLNHMRAASFHEWTIVLATLLQRIEILLELFRSDLKLFRAFSTTLLAQANAAQYKDMLSVLETELRPLLIASESQRLTSLASPGKLRSASSS